MDPAASTETVENVVQIVQSIDHKELISGLIVLVVGIILVQLIMHLITKALQRGRLIPPTLHGMLKTFLRFVLYVIVVMFAANVAGIPITSFVAVFSVIGLAVTLSVQGLLTNLVGGINLLVSKPFEVGNYVETPGFAGTVKEIGVMHTRLQTYDGKWMYVPNSEMVSSRVINYTRSENRRVDLLFSASYDDVPSHVIDTLNRAIADVPGVLSDPPWQVHVDNYGDSAIVYSVWVWCAASDFFSVKFALNESVYGWFKDAGITMTYPNVNVFMKKE